VNPIILVVGARPNFMKIAPLYDELKSRELPVLLVHTGQHYDENMSKIFFDELEMPKPDVYLGVGSGSHAGQTARIMLDFEKVCDEKNPSMVIVAGDVNSTIACALVAAKLLIPVAHVEAGLRSFDMSMPEEINRILNVYRDRWTGTVQSLLLPAGAGEYRGAAISETNPSSLWVGTDSGVQPLALPGNKLYLVPTMLGSIGVRDVNWCRSGNLYVAYNDRVDRYQGGIIPNGTMAFPNSRTRGALVVVRDLVDPKAIVGLVKPEWVGLLKAPFSAG